MASAYNISADRPITDRAEWNDPAPGSSTGLCLSTSRVNDADDTPPILTDDWPLIYSLSGMRSCAPRDRPKRRKARPG